MTLEVGGDIGARDPTSGELASNFNETSMGEADTDHMLRIPNAVREVVGLHKRSCVAVSESRARALRRSPHCSIIVYQCPRTHSPHPPPWPGHTRPLQLNLSVCS